MRGTATSTATGAMASAAISAVISAVISNNLIVDLTEVRQIAVFRGRGCRVPRHIECPPWPEYEGVVLIIAP